MTKEGIPPVPEPEPPLIDDDDVAQLLDRLGPEQSEGAKGSEPYVLVVDDDAVSRFFAKAVLERNGFRVAEAEDGLAALAHLRTAPDARLMVLDLDMPNLGGLEVLDRVRREVTTAALPVIVLTGTMDEEAEVAAIERGADDYVRKPLEPPRFLARVKAALRRADG